MLSISIGNPLLQMHLISLPLGFMDHIGVERWRHDLHIDCKTIGYRLVSNTDPDKCFDDQSSVMSKTISILRFIEYHVIISLTKHHLPQDIEL